MTLARSGATVDTGVGVLDRAMGVVHAVDAGARTLGEIATASGLPRSTAHRLIRALEAHGILRFEGGSGYRLGPLLQRLGARAAGELALADVARPILEHLTESTGESSQLYVRFDDERLCVASVESPSELRTIVAVGAEMPLARGSAGKIFLAWAPSGDRERLLAGLPDRERLERQLATVRRRGWAQSAGERQPGVGSVSAPVRDRTGVLGAVSVSGPEARMRGQHAERYAPAVLAAARDLERSLGYAPGR